jgi:hypothetical protein
MNKTMVYCKPNIIAMGNTAEIIFAMLIKGADQSQRSDSGGGCFLRFVRSRKTRLPV